MARKKPPPRVHELHPMPVVLEAYVEATDAPPISDERVAEIMRRAEAPTGAQLSLIDPADVVVDAMGSDSYCTPPEIYEPVLDFIGRPLFDLDPCTNEHSTVPARRIYTLADDGLNQSWAGKTVWCNPPYSKPAPWIDRLAARIPAGLSEKSERFALVKLDPTTNWFQPLWRASALLFLKDRIRFLLGGRRTATATFPSVLAYWGEHPEAFAVALAPLGVVLPPELAASRGTIFRACVLE